MHIFILRKISIKEIKKEKEKGKPKVGNKLSEYPNLN
jgi:hypothetical protein